MTLLANPMTLTFEPATFLGFAAVFVVTAIGAVIIYILKSLLSEFKQLKGDVKRQGEEVHNIRVDLAKIEGRVTVNEQWIKKYNEDIPNFYKDFPKMVREAVSDALGGLEARVRALEDEKKK